MIGDCIFATRMSWRQCRSRAGALQDGFRDSRFFCRVLKVLRMNNRQTSVPSGVAAPEQRGSARADQSGRAHQPIQRLLRHLVLLLSVFPVASLQAETRELEVAPGIVATAVYQPGRADRAAVLVLHGFLQTARFPTVNRLAEGLSDEGHTVLAPTLSLGITRRRQSQPCEAPHLQRLEDDVAEIARWVNWLHSETGQAVVLVGHSSGGHAITRYLHEHPQAPVERVLLISLGYPRGHPVSPEPPQAKSLGIYSLDFCQSYPTTPEAFHSYIGWGPQQILQALQQARMPVYVIFGSMDKRLSPDWFKAVSDSDISIEIVAGADHFFDSTHEFDLLETAIRLMPKNQR